MTRRDRSACATFQAALIEFADRPQRTMATAAALAHLERCRSCEDELAGIVRTIAGLRGLAHSLVGVEPAHESWPTLRARVSRPEPSPLRWSYSLGGIVATAAIVLLVLPSIGSSPVRQAMGLDTPAAVDAPASLDALAGSLIGRREDVVSSPVARSPRAPGASPEDLPRTVRWPASGPSGVSRDGAPARALSAGTGSAGTGVTSIRRTPTDPNPSTRRPGPGHRIDAI